MGASAKRPTFGTTGAVGSNRSPDFIKDYQKNQIASNFYENALNQQKQAVANVPATQDAQNTSGMPPNRPEPSFLNQPAQTSTGSPAPNLQAAGSNPNDQYQQAYSQYMQRHGGVGIPGERPQQPGAPGEMAQQFNNMGAPTKRQQMTPPGQPMENQQRQQNRKGITMGAGYASRPFG